MMGERVEHIGCRMGHAGEPRDVLIGVGRTCWWGGVGYACPRKIW